MIKDSIGIESNQFLKMMYIAQIWPKSDVLYNIRYLYLKQVITIVTQPQKHPKSSHISVKDYLSRIYLQWLASRSNKSIG